MTKQYNTFAEAMKDNNNDMTKFELNGTKYVQKEIENDV